MGIAIDPGRNDAARGLEADVSPAGAPCRVQVVPTNEELLIARDTYRIVRGLPLS
jgi:acetate kinase